ncbi:MAG: hypothetical protein GWP08_19840 [Nitrospiraceae bacterium]|nr:hypothetical protein [Nitrospiraceae bacterium]
MAPALAAILVLAAIIVGVWIIGRLARWYADRPRPDRRHGNGTHYRQQPPADVHGRPPGDGDAGGTND